MGQLLSVLAGLFGFTALLIVLALTLGSRSRGVGTLEHLSAARYSVDERNESVYTLEGDGFGGTSLEDTLRDAPIEMLQQAMQSEEERKRRFDRRRERDDSIGRMDADGFMTILVGPGDTLRSLAAEHLGDGDLWREIVRYNRAKVRTGRDLRTDMRLRIPTWLAREGR